MLSNGVDDLFATVVTLGTMTLKNIKQNHDKSFVGKIRYICTI